MGESNGRPVVPVCMLAHELLNRLTVIIGNCDLAIERAAELAWIKHLYTIRETARCMVVELNRHQCELTVQLRTTVMEKGKFIT